MESMGNASEPVRVAGSLSGSLRMHFPESLLVTVFESQVPVLLVARPSLLEIFLRHHVQFGCCRQFCASRRLLSGFLSDPISSPLLRRSAVSCTMSVERRHTTHHEGCHCHHHKETQRLKFSRHDSARQSCTLLADKFDGKSRPKDWKIRGKAGGTVAAVCDRRNS